jgi:hypothetical protein
MAYVEWLRVRGCLKWCAIVLGILFLISAIFRIAVIGVQHDILSWAANMKSDPGAKVTDTRLPDGTHRVVIDDPAKKTHVVIDDRGPLGKHIEILEHGESHQNSVTAESVHVKTLPHNGGTLTIIDAHGATPFAELVIHGLILALIVATVLGVPFARENDGHLETALTKPVSREGLAWQTMAADVAGILGSFVLGLAFALAVSAMFEAPNLTFDSTTGLALGIAILAPIAWYAMLAAATASVKRGYGAILGFAWPVAAIVVGLSLVPPSGSAFLTLVHGIAWVLSWIDPLTYMHFSQHEGVTVNGRAILHSTGWSQVLLLAVLSVLYSVLAIVQWRRVEV